MFKKIKNTLLVFGLSVTAAISSANAVPLLIDTELGTCYYSGQNQYNYIYTCAGGALWYVRKNTGGGGNGGGGDDDGCPPHAIICD